MVSKTTRGNELGDGTSARMWLAIGSTDYGPPYVSLGVLVPHYNKERKKRRVSVE